MNMQHAPLQSQNPPSTLHPTTKVCLHQCACAVLSVSHSWSWPDSLSGYSVGSTCISRIITFRSSTSFLDHQEQSCQLWFERTLREHPAAWYNLQNFPPRLPVQDLWLVAPRPNSPLKPRPPPREVNAASWREGLTEFASTSLFTSLVRRSGMALRMMSFIS